MSKEQNDKTIEIKEEAVARSFKEIFSSREYFVATVKQFLKFGFVGIINTVINIGILMLFTEVFGWRWQTANILGFVLSVINAFLWNAFWVFKGNREGFKKTIPKFVITYVVTFLLAQFILLPILIDNIGIKTLWASLCSTCVTTLINFFLSKFWTFKK